MPAAAAMSEYARDIYVHMIAMEFQYLRRIPRDEAAAAAESLRARVSEDAKGEFCGLSPNGNPITGGVAGLVQAYLDEETARRRVNTKRAQMEQLRDGTARTLTL